MAKNKSEEVQPDVAAPTSLVDVEFLVQCNTTLYGNFIAYQKAQLPSDFAKQLEESQVLIITN